MSSPYPSSIASLTNPLASDRLNSPDHAQQHTDANDNIKSIQSFIGTQSSMFGITYDVRSPNSNGGGHVQTADKGGTGQTSYTKGDTLVASSSSVLGKLAVGGDGQALVADSTKTSGVTWRGVPILDYQVFTGSGVWNKPSVLTGNELVFVQLWGGGGAGGGTANASTPQAGGGGGGAYVEGYFRASVLSASIMATVGASVIGVSSTAGSTGKTSDFGSILTAWGGGGGDVRTTNGNSAGAGGGGWVGAGAGAGAGNGGGPGGATSSASILSAQGGGAGGPGGTAGTFGYYGGGGGGGGGGAGADSFFGGGGGGGGGGAAAGISRSLQGGAGGAGGSVSVGGAGSAPGGGGGGAQSAGAAFPGGTGARGEIRVTVL